MWFFYFRPHLPHSVKTDLKDGVHLLVRPAGEFFHEGEQGLLESLLGALVKPLFQAPPFNLSVPDQNHPPP
jgi:hypothetical protein